MLKGGIIGFGKVCPVMPRTIRDARHSVAVACGMEESARAEPAGRIPPAPDPG